MLKLLRYLDLTDSLVTKLPNSLTRLYNLEYLILSYCEVLKELPLDIGKLINLSYLDISKSGIEQQLPQGIQNLKKMQKLTHFIVGGNNGLSVAALGGMTYLRGELNVSSLENVSCVEDARMAKLREKKLEVLSLQWNRITERNEDSSVLDELQPEADLKVLSVRNYSGQLMCSWLDAAKLRQLKELHLHGCVRCAALPAMGSFPFLRHASVKTMSILKSIGMEWYGSSSDIFPSLEILEFEELDELQEWEYYDGIRFPRMKSLRISDCPLLRVSKCLDLLASMPMLDKLQVDECGEVVLSLPQLPVLDNLLACNCKEVRCVEDFNVDALQEFVCCSRISDVLEEKIKNGSHRARFLAIDDNFSSSQLVSAGIGTYRDVFRPLWVLPSFTLVADGDDTTKYEMKVEALFASDRSMKDLPTWICDAKFLKKMVLRDCGSLIALSAPGQLDELNISRCPKLHEIIHKFTCLWGFTLDWSMWNLIKTSGMVLSNLVYLWFSHCPGIKAFPEENLSVSFPNLKFLNLEDFSDLTYLTSLKGFKSVERIVTHDCPRLEMLSEKLPSSIIELWIFGSDLIEQKVKVLDAELIAKISHIPSVMINGCRYI